MPAAAVQQHAAFAAADPEEGKSLPNMRTAAKLLFGMAAQEQRKEKPDGKRIQELVEAACRVTKDILPYEFRRLATLEPAMETVIKPDGSVHVTITKTDAEL